METIPGTSILILKGEAKCAGRISDQPPVIKIVGNGRYFRAIVAPQATIEDLPGIEIDEHTDKKRLIGIQDVLVARMPPEQYPTAEDVRRSIQNDLPPSLDVYWIEGIVVSRVVIVPIDNPISQQSYYLTSLDVLAMPALPGAGGASGESDAYSTAALRKIKMSCEPLKRGELR